MHEMSIAENLLEVIARHAPTDGRAKVIGVRLRIGELTSVVPESLRFCFQIASEGTITHGAELKIETVPVVGRCSHCRMSFNVQDHCFVCQGCGSTDVELVSGNELDVVELEISEE
jgi:hydrogenase nickel incorporation protein HypA/HybF